MSETPDPEKIIEDLVSVLNARINIPGIWDEEQEAMKIRSALELIIPAIPASIWPFLLTAADGLTDAELEATLQVILNNIARVAVAPLPSFVQVYISSQIHDAFEPLVKIVLGFAQSGANIGLDS